MLLISKDCRWYIPQASRAFGLPRIDELSDEILEVAHERNAFLRLGFSKRDMLRATNRRADELAPALERLVEGGHLVAERIGRTTRYRIVKSGELVQVSGERQ